MLDAANIPTNIFKRALRQNEPLIGLWSSMCSPVALEISVDAGFDWIVLDTEHSPVEVADLYGLLQATERGRAVPAVRIAWHDQVLIKRVLDLGVQTVLIPFIEDESQARQAVAACHYPPRGARGVAGSTRATRYGRVTDYFARCEAEICILVQVETREALARLEQIAAVDGIDGVFIGPSDLAASMGHLGNPGHLEVQDALRKAAYDLRTMGKPAGTLATNPEDARRYLSWGYSFVTCAVDTGLLARELDRAVIATKA